MAVGERADDRLRHSAAQTLITNTRTTQFHPLVHPLASHLSLPSLLRGAAAPGLPAGVCGGWPPTAHRRGRAPGVRARRPGWGLGVWSACGRCGGFADRVPALLSGLRSALPMPAVAGSAPSVLDWTLGAALFGKHVGGPPSRRAADVFPNGGCVRNTPIRERLRTPLPLAAYTGRVRCPVSGPRIYHPEVLLLTFRLVLVYLNLL